jgi:hypothetical protein
MTEKEIKKITTLNKELTQRVEELQMKVKQAKLQTREQPQKLKT